MAIYYGLIGATILAAFVYKYSKINVKRKKNRTALVFFGTLLIMLCLRSVECGIDLINYKYAFDAFAKHPFSLGKFAVLKGSYGFETGYVALNILVQIFTRDFQWIIVVVAIISLIPVYVFYRRESRNQLLSIALFLTFGLLGLYFSTLRQIIAMAFVFPAYKFVRKRKFIPFLLMVLAAMLFHKSAFVMLAMYPAYSFQFRKKHLFFILPVIAAIFVFNKQIFSLLLSLISYEGEIESTNAYSILILLVLLALFTFIIPNEKKVTKEFVGLRNLLLVSIALQMFSPVNTVAMRMNYYYLLLVPVTVTWVSPIAAKKYRRVAKLAVAVMTVFFLFVYVVSAAPGDILEIYPYIPFWQQ